MAIKVTQDKSGSRSYIWGTVFFVLAAFVALSLLSYDVRDIAFNTTSPNLPVKNYTGLIGSQLAFAFYFMFGLGSLVVPLLLLVLAYKSFRAPVHPGKPVVSIAIMLAIVSCFLGMRDIALLHPLTSQLNIVGAGGLFGYRISKAVLVKYIGEEGSLIVLIPVFILALALFFDFKFADLAAFVKSVFSWIMSFGDRIQRKTVVEQRKIDLQREMGVRPAPAMREFKGIDPFEPKPRARSEQKLAVDTTQEPPPPPVKKNIVFNIPDKILKEFKPKSPAPKKETAAAKDGAVPAQQKESMFGEYQLPPLDLLEHAPGVDTEGLKDDLERNSVILEGTLKDFGIDAQVVEVQRGPVITTYEVQPAPGVRVNRITALADDIALAMKAASIRIVAPIPGKASVGIEVPNTKGAMVSLKELLLSPGFKSSRAKLPMLFGKDVQGQTIIADMTEMPHLLIAGTTGSGKTVCMNTIILSILFTMTPDEAKLLLVDPKKVELLAYKNLPHLVCPVVTDPKRATSALNWAVKEMEKRYAMFAYVGVRNIVGFNTRPDREVLRVGENGEAVPKTLPYIMVIIDELNDLMMVAPDDIENAITRLAQLSRAVGIHVILATQRPSVNVITGVIKANFPARIAFQVASKVDSRTILDANGADKLLGKGDMLFLPPGSAKLIRAQGAYVTDKEINRVIEFIEKQGKAEFDDTVLQTSPKAGAAGGGGGDDDIDDDLYEQAVQVVLQTQQASASVLQRKLRVGYARAARLIDIMEEQGVVGPHKGSKGRDILVKAGGGGQSVEPEEEAVEEQKEVR
ncbi:MAG TPA: DNA translocase FtsK [bacterium]|nr:DNA translocase FtsK [bacterium]